MEKKLLATLQFTLSTFVIVKALIANYNKIKGANRIFLNSQGFGHSIIDTIAYLEHYGSNVLVISLGTNAGQNHGSERNLYFNYYFDEYGIISLHLPTFFLRKESWTLLHPFTKSILKVFCIIIGKKHIIVDENNEQVNLELLPKKIALHMQITIEDSIGILNEVCSAFKIAENHYQSPHTINFLFKQPIRNVEDLNKFLNNVVREKINAEFEDNLFVCLAIRRGNAPYHSTADYYFSVIDSLHAKGFRIYLLGDTNFLLKSIQGKTHYYARRIINFNLTKSDSKLLDIIAISKCAFVVGDQGGVWSLVSAFNRPGLIINSSCVAHLQFNVESLPRKWINESSQLQFVDARLLFNEMYFRYKPFTLPSGASRVVQAENDLDLILKVVERFTSNFEYLNQRKMNDIILRHFPLNKQVLMARNSSYSPDYLDRLEF